LIIDLVSEHASPLAAPGGAEAGEQSVHVGALAAALARRGHAVTVHTRRDDVALPDSVPYAPGVTVEHVRAGPARPIERAESLPPLPEFAAHLARRWSVRPPDVVHAHSWTSGLAALDGAGDRGIPIVQTFHGLGGVTDRRDDGRIRHEALIVRDVTAVIATCRDEAAELAAYGVRPGTVHVVPCGVDLERFRPGGATARRGDRPRVLTIGRLASYEGVDTVIDALCHVPDAELVVAGGPHRAELDRDDEARRLRRLAQDRGVSGRVTFTGRIPHAEVPSLIRSADVVASVAWYEPFALVAIEAMACGVPVVVSSVGAHLDTVADGVTGLHVPPGVPGTLAGRLRRLLTDPRLGAFLGAGGAARTAERHPWSRIAAETESVYHHVVGPAQDAVVAGALS
jgi:D-inositol-3-phosphate glycosyltransferase